MSNDAMRDMVQKLEALVEASGLMLKLVQDMGKRLDAAQADADAEYFDIPGTLRDFRNPNWNPDAPAAPVQSEAKPVLYQIQDSLWDGTKFWADASEKEYEDARMNGSNVRRIPELCKGPNCGCSDGVSHSAECLAHHENSATPAPVKPAEE